MSEKFGFLNIYKPRGMTSFDVIPILRKTLGIKQIGHAGTLDPFAQGVLPVAVGKATRLIEYLDGDKEYSAEVSFGKATDTYDCEGNTIFEADSKIVLEDVKLGLKAFEGEILQTPPIYSAIKVNGKRLYEYAREGKSDEVKIEPRKVFIKKIELKSFNFEEQKAEILIECSKGTYIRSIAHELGQNLGCGGYLSKLERTKAGKFFVENTITLDEVKENGVEGYLIEPADVLELEKVELNEKELEKVKTGQSIENRFGVKSENIMLVCSGEICAIAKISGDKLKVKKVFI